MPVVWLTTLKVHQVPIVRAGHGRRQIEPSSIGGRRWHRSLHDATGLDPALRRVGCDKERGREAPAVHRRFHNPVGGIRGRVAESARLCVVAKPILKTGAPGDDHRGELGGVRRPARRWCHRILRCSRVGPVRRAHHERGLTRCCQDEQRHEGAAAVARPCLFIRPSNTCSHRRYSMSARESPHAFSARLSCGEFGAIRLSRASSIFEFAPVPWTPPLRWRHPWNEEPDESLRESTKPRS